MVDNTRNFEQLKEYIRGANPLSEIASEYIEVPTNWKKPILCFMHNETTPSCFLHPSGEYFKCFGCGKVIDVFGFIMKFENLDFMGAFRFLAKRANIKLPQYQKEDEEKLTKNLEQNQKEAELFEAVITILKEQQHGK